MRVTRLDAYIVMLSKERAGSSGQLGIVFHGDDLTGFTDEVASDCAAVASSSSQVCQHVAQAQFQCVKGCCIGVERRDGRQPAVPQGESLVLSRDCNVLELYEKLSGEFPAVLFPGCYCTASPWRRAPAREPDALRPAALRLPRRARGRSWAFTWPLRPRHR